MYVEEFLELSVDTDNQEVSLFDNEIETTIFNGSAEDAIEQYGLYEVDSFDLIYKDHPNLVLNVSR